MFEPVVGVRRFVRHEFRVDTEPPSGVPVTHRDVQDAALFALKGVRDALGQDAAGESDALRVGVDGATVVFWFEVEDDEP